MTARRILAIDPGFRATGWVVVEPTHDGPSFVACGLIRTERDTRTVLRSTDDWRCYQAIMRGVRAAHLARRPSVMIVETPAGSQSSRAAASMASAFAICAALADTHDIPTVLVSAEEAKLAATGKRNGSKAEVAAAVSHFVPASAVADAVGRKKSAAEHITDAAALVLAAWDHDVIRMLRNQQRGE